MGYTPGQGIGKKESGISEPISIDLKTNRLGLGRAIKKKSVSVKNGKPAIENFNTDDFRGRMSQRKNNQLVEIDLRKSQKSCEELDTKNGVKKPEEIWYWPIIEEKKEDESGAETDSEEETEVEEDSMTSIEKLDILTKYLREKYFYCIWCGAAYDDDDDLRDNCPGRTRDNH